MYDSKSDLGQYMGLTECERVRVICVFHTSVYTHTYRERESYIYIYVCIYIYTYIYIYIYIYTYILRCIHIYMYIYVYVYICIYTCVCVCILYVCHSHVKIFMCTSGICVNYVFNMFVLHIYIYTGVCHILQENTYIYLQHSSI